MTEAIAVVRKRKWILIACALLGLIYGFYTASTQPILYTATGRIEVRSSTSASQFAVNNVMASGDDDNNLDTEVQILTSDSLLLTVAREMNLANNPDFTGAKGPQPFRNVSDPVVRSQIIRQLGSDLAVNVILRTKIIRITCITGKAQLSADIVNHLISAYQQRSFESRFESTQRVSKWLSAQLDDLKQQVETSQEQLIDLQKKLGFVGVGLDFGSSSSGSGSSGGSGSGNGGGSGGGGATTSTNASVDGLLAAASTAKVNRILAESRYRVLSSSDPNLLESNLDANGGQSELSKLRADIADTRAQLAQSSITMGPKNPTILSLQAHLTESRRELNDEQQRLLTEAKQTLVAAKANEDQTNAAVEDEKNEAFKMRDDMVEYSLRQRDYEASRTLYEGLLSRLRAASVQAGLDAQEIDIVDPAYKPATMTLTPRSSVIGKMLGIAIILGLILTFTMESLDNGIRSVAEIEQVTQMPSLAVIPRIRRLAADSGAMTVAQANVAVLATSKSQFSEAFRSLRTSLLLAGTGHPPKLILISSATPTEGKTTVATNLACILAQRETKVILIDADLRRPNVHHRFGLNGRVGLSTVLSGAAKLEDAVRNIPEVPNLDVLTSGPVPPFPTEMLSSEAMHDLLHLCAERYTHIVIDSPPILSVTDGIILARQADAVVLVVRHSKSSRQAVRRARDLLARVGSVLTGVVLNAVDINSPEYHGYYGYSGYSYSNIDSESWESGANGNQGNNREPGDQA